MYHVRSHTILILAILLTLTLQKLDLNTLFLINETRYNANTMKLRPLMSFKKLYVFICKHSLVLVLCVSPESKIISIILVIIIIIIIMTI